MGNLLGRDPASAILILAGVLWTAVLCASFLIAGNFFVSGLISGSFLGLGILLHRFGGHVRDLGAATALLGQAIGLTAGFQGHDWQLDTHMLFFALLACLVLMRSVPAILMATAITAGHHLALSFLMPALVFPSADVYGNLGRAVFHAAVVLLETAVLVLTVVVLKRHNAEARRNQDALKATLRQSDKQREEAEAAQRNAERAQQKAKEAQEQAEKLLLEAKASEKLRVDAENERERAAEEFARTAQLHSEEQSRVVSVVREAMKRLQANDLTARIDTDLGEAYRDVAVAFNDAVEALDATLGQVALQSTEIRSQVAEIASATADLATRTENQAQMLRESSERLEELTSVVSRTEETVQEADTSAQSAQNSAKSSEVIVAATSDAMHAIKTEAEEISQIVKVIDDIAFQTNLLALNAGVEAARAGDAGRGFAVVASEVRGLAQRSSESATNIRALIERSGQQVEVGSSKIDETVNSLSAVLEAVFEISTKTGQIAEGAKEQTSSISELNQRVARLDTTTQQNAAMFEETSAACSNLEYSANALQDLTEKFRVTERNGQKATAA